MGAARNPRAVSAVAKPPSIDLASFSVRFSHVREASVCRLPRVPAIPRVLLVAVPRQWDGSSAAAAPTEWNHGEQTRVLANVNELGPTRNIEDEIKRANGRRSDRVSSRKKLNQRPGSKTLLRTQMVGRTRAQPDFDFC